MKTNYTIALKVPAQWKAPWRMPVRSTPLDAERTLRNRMLIMFQDKLQKTAQDFQEIINKHWLHD
jgi:hypothetical protein